MPECRVPIDQLRIGVFIRLEYKWTQHPFLFSSFKIKNQEQIDTLRELGITTVMYIPEKSDCLPLPPANRTPGHQKAPSCAQDTKPKKAVASKMWGFKKQQIKLQKLRRERFRTCENNFKQTMERVTGIMANLATASNEVVAEAASIVQTMVDTLLGDKDNVINLMNTHAGEQDVFYHALNTSVLGMILGKECGLEADAIQKMGLGLLFHDIGKFRIPKKILLKQSSLALAELKLLQLHPVYGEEMLSGTHNFPGDSMKVVRHHHEAIDGSGYPDGLSGEQLSTTVKIAAIVNTYDNYCNRHDPKSSLTPAQALSVMFARQKRELDAKLLTAFIRCLGIYPPGSIVQLSNRCVGMVVSASPKNSLRPEVLIYDAEVPKREALVLSLEAEREVSIVKSLRPDELPPAIYDYLSPRTRVTYFIDHADKQSRT